MFWARQASIDLNILLSVYGGGQSRRQSAVSYCCIIAFLLTVDVHFEARAVGDRGHLRCPLRADRHRPTRVLRVFEAQQGRTAAGVETQAKTIRSQESRTLIGRGGRSSEI